MRLLNMLLFTVSAVLLFRAARSAFGPLPAFGGLAVMMFLPTLFLWSISLLKEPLYLFGTTLVIAGAIAAAGAAHWRDRTLPSSAYSPALPSSAICGRGPSSWPHSASPVASQASCSSRYRVRSRLTLASAAVVAVLAIASQPSAQQRLASALETTAKTHAGHVFTVGHSYKLLDEGFYINPVAAAASTLTLTAGEAARYAARAAVSIVTVPWPWQLASSRELPYLPEQLLWYVIVALLPVGLVAGWRRDPLVTSLLAGYTLPTAAALALTNGNVGTLLRLRGMIIPYLIWLSAVGFCAALQRLAPRAATT